MKNSKWFWLLAPLMLISAALAEEASKKESPCKKYVDLYCFGIKQGGGRIPTCLRAHIHELSPECKERVNELAPKSKKQKGNPPHLNEVTDPTLKH